MKFDHVPVVYVDHQYKANKALTCYFRDPSEMGDVHDKPLITLVYIPEDTRAELVRGNVTAALKVVYDVRHESHPSLARTVEHEVSQKRSPAPPPGAVLGLLTEHKPTGFHVKPGGFYLMPDETIPEQKILVEEETKTETPIAQEPDSSKSGHPITVVSLDMVSGEYEGVQLIFPIGPRIIFRKRKATAEYMAKHEITDEQKLTGTDLAAIDEMPDHFPTDLAVAEKWLTDRNMPGKLDDSVISYQKVLGINTSVQ